MFKKNISHQEILIAIVIYLISVPFVFQLLEKQYVSFGLVKGGAEGFDGKITDNMIRKGCINKCKVDNIGWKTGHSSVKRKYKNCKDDCKNL